MYPGDALATIVMVLEDAFTLFFSTEKLHAFSVHDFMQFLSSVTLRQVGGELHRKELAAKIVVGCMYTNSLNKNKALQRERQKHLKLRRVK